MSPGSSSVLWSPPPSSLSLRLVEKQVLGAKAVGQRVFCYTALHIYFDLIQRRTCVLTEQRKRWGKSLFKGKTDARGSVKWCSTLLPSHPNDCPKGQCTQILLSFARLGPQEGPPSISEVERRTGVVQESCPPPSGRLLRRPVAPIRVLCGCHHFQSFPLYSISPHKMYCRNIRCV